MKHLVLIIIVATGLTACNKNYKFSSADATNIAASVPDPVVTPTPTPTPPACTSDYDQWLSDGTATVACAQTCPDGTVLQCTAQVEKEMVCTNGAITESGQTRYASISDPQNACPAPATKDVTETYDVPTVMGKADILIELDTSGSMDNTLLKLSQRLASLTSKFSKIDWQIGITNVGLGSGLFYRSAENGKIMTLKKSPTVADPLKRKIITSSMSNGWFYFQQSIARPTSMDDSTYSAFCNLAPFCMDFYVHPQPLKTIITAMAASNTDNKGFFRSGSYLVPIIISDADENEDGSGATTPAQTVQAFKNSFGSTMKDIIGFSIVIPPGDSTCLKKHQDLFKDGTFGKYGTFAASFSKLTGGDVLSLCDDDYTANLAKISDKVREKIESIEIHQVPIAGTLQVTFTPAANISWTLSGSTILFDQELPVGTHVSITYKVKN